MGNLILWILIKNESEEAIEKLEAKVADHAGHLRHITEIIKKATNAFANLGKLCAEGNVKEKREIIGSTFPEKLYFDDIGCQTAKINEGVLLIYQLINKLQGQKKGQICCFQICPKR